MTRCDAVLDITPKGIIRCGLPKNHEGPHRSIGWERRNGEANRNRATGMPSQEGGPSWTKYGRSG